MLSAPPNQSLNNRHEGFAVLGDRVLDSDRPGVAHGSLDQPVHFEVPQFFREHLSGYAAYVPSNLQEAVSVRMINRQIYQDGSFPFAA